MDGHVRPRMPSLSELLEMIPDIVLVVDRHGVLQYINRVERGFARSDVVGQPAAAILPAGSTETFYEALRAAVEEGTPQEYEVEIPFPDGSRHWYRSRMNPIARDGEVVAAMIMASEVTELKQAQRTVAQLRSLLPVCAWCDKIQSDAGYWERIEVYLKKQTGSEVTHGMCPDCYERQMRKLDSGGGAA